MDGKFLDFGTGWRQEVSSSLGRFNLGERPPLKRMLYGLQGQSEQYKSQSSRPSLYLKSSCLVNQPIACYCMHRAIAALDDVGNR
jgi:hypothetical protein